MKKLILQLITAPILTLLLIITILPMSTSANDNTVANTNSEVNQNTGVTATISNNANRQNYTTWARPINSYLIANPDQTYTRVEYTTGTYNYEQNRNESKLILEQYRADFSLISVSEIPLELSSFGGFYSGAEYNFIVFGQNNPTEDNSLEVIRVVKYTKDWQRLGAVGLSNCNTTVPFDAGSLRMTEYGNMLYIRTSHEMYRRSDGINHQANMTFSVSISDMRVTDIASGVSNASHGYASHSFNQFITTSGNTLAAVDHGDAYPRSIALFVYSTHAGGTHFTSGSNVRAINIFSIPGSIGQNYTGASVGGFEVSSTSYLVAGNSVSHNGTYNDNRTRNIFVAITPIHNPSSTNTEVKWLTNYTENGQPMTSTPHLVSIYGNTSVILWAEGDTVRYAALDRNGNMKTDIKTMDGALSDCKPIVANGKIIWYVTSNSAPVFYSIDLEELLIPQNITVSGPSNKTYGDAPFALTVTPDPVSRLSDFVFASGAISIAEIDQNGLITIRGCGTTTITVMERGDEDYAPVTRTHELSVSEATLEVMVDDIDVIYGDVLPELSISYSGFVYGEDENDLIEKPGILFTSSEIINAGAYVLYATGGDSDNYRLSYNSGTLTVMPREITISGLSVHDLQWSNPNASATILNFGYELSNKIAGDELDIDISAMNTVIMANTSRNAVNVQINRVSLIGEMASNYTLPATVLTVETNIANTLSAHDIATAITGIRPIMRDSTRIDFPNVPEGFAIELVSIDGSAIDMDGNVARVNRDTDVGLVFRVTRQSDETSAETALIVARVPESTIKDITNTVTIIQDMHTATGGVSPGVIALVDSIIDARSSAAARLHIYIEAVSPAVTVYTKSDVPVVATIIPLNGMNASDVTTMAMLNDDGTLTPVITRVNTDGTISVIITGDVTLIPLSVVSEFTDIAEHWAQQEINHAASMMIIEGVGDGVFDPSASVTNAAAVTMILRALGIFADRNAPAQSGIDQTMWYAVNMNTAAYRGWISNGIEPDTPMSRIETAGLIVAALRDLGMSPSINIDEISPLLAQFEDLDDLTESEREQLAICVRLGIFRGNGDGTIGPRDELTRAGMATLAVRIQELILA